MCHKPSLLVLFAAAFLSGRTAAGVVGSSQVTSSSGFWTADFSAFSFDDPGADVADFNTTSAPDNFSSWSLSDTLAFPFATASVAHQSTIVDELFEIDTSISAMTDPGGFHYELFDLVNLNRVEIEFTVTETTEFVLDASLVAGDSTTGVGDPNGFLAIAEVFLRGDGLDYRGFTDSGVLDLSERFILDVGTYSFAVQTEVRIGDIGIVDPADLTASFAGTFGIIPSPPTLALIGLGGLVASGRRRGCIGPLSCSVDGL